MSFALFFPLGAILGAVLGASKGMSAFPRHLIDGLVNKDEISREINQFVDLIAQKARAKSSGAAETAR